MPRASHHHTVARQWAILRKLTARRPGITARELQDHLASEGFVVTKRTVERDLVDLSTIFPLITSPGSPKGWRWTERGLLDVPGVDVMEALSLVLVGDLLRQMLPASLNRSVQTRFEVAKSLLDAIPGNRFAAWSQIARYIPSGLQLQPPVVDEKVLEAIEESLITHQCLRVAYLSVGAEEPRDFLMHPLALLLHGSSPYLLATIGKGSSIFQYPLHRFRSAEVISETSWRPAKFSLDAFLSSGDASFGAGDLINFEAKVADHLATILKETPLTPDQKIIRRGDEYIVKAKVRNSWELEFWILSQADRLTVIRPKHLREKIRGFLSSALSNYNDTD